MPTLPRSRPRSAGQLPRLALAALVALSGCRSTGSAAHDFLRWGSATFAPNPVANVPFHAGLAVGFVAGLPFALITWPLSAAFYPEEDEREFYLSSVFAPGIFLGTFLGTVLASPLSPLGLPWVPEAPEPGPPRETTPPPVAQQREGASAVPAARDQGGDEPSDRAGAGAGAGE